MLRHGLPEAGPLYLTFDDGPDPEWTPRVLDLLAAAGAKAAFFMIGIHARARPDLVRRVVDEGHELGNHTQTHAHPWTLRRAAARREVREGTAMIADACGIRPLFYRPPHGRVRRCMVDQAEQEGQRTLLWTRSAVDWGPFGHPAAVARRMRASQAGDILLMHDGGRGPNRPASTCAALAALLSSLAARQLQPGSLRDLQPNFLGALSPR